MSKLQESQYYTGRALQERRMVEAASDPRAVAAHSELAARYEALASFPSLNLPTLRVRERMTGNRLHAKRSAGNDPGAPPFLQPVVSGA